MTTLNSFSFWVAVQTLSNCISMMATNNQLKDKRDIPVEQLQHGKEILNFSRMMRRVSRSASR